jgi:hypothetical protein
MNQVIQPKLDNLEYITNRRAHLILQYRPDVNFLQEEEIINNTLLKLRKKGILGRYDYNIGYMLSALGTITLYAASTSSTMTSTKVLDQDVPMPTLLMAPLSLFMNLEDDLMCAGSLHHMNSMETELALITTKTTHPNFLKVANNIAIHHLQKLCLPEPLLNYPDMLNVQFEERIKMKDLELFHNLIKAYISGESMQLRVPEPIKTSNEPKPKRFRKGKEIDLREKASKEDPTLKLTEEVLSKVYPSRRALNETLEEKMKRSGMQGHIGSSESVVESDSTDDTTSSRRNTAIGKVKDLLMKKIHSPTRVEVLREHPTPTQSRANSRSRSSSVSSSNTTKLRKKQNFPDELVPGDSASRSSEFIG